MKHFLRILKWIGTGVAILVLFLAISLRVNYGGGKDYPDISTAPRYDDSQLELFFSFDEPIGNVAATPDTSGQTRVFFTIHPESRPATNKLMEIVNGKAMPYPNTAAQNSLFNTPLGVFADLQNRLWVIDHGFHGTQEVKLTAFDLSNDEVVHEYVFPKNVAETFSFFNDLSVTPDGRYVFISDVSFFGKKPSLVVYDMIEGKSRNVLDKHSSVRHEGYVPTTPAKKMRFLGGLVDLLVGIDGLDLSRDGQYIYWAPMGHSGLFRLPVELATDFSASEETLWAAVERVGDKPLSDGIRTDSSGNVYITDIEHSGIYVIPPKGEGYTLIKDSRIRWADGMALAGDGHMYLADSDIPNQMLQSKEHMKKNAPYHIFRFKLLN
jgi:sugar lactone lactonase YvrE